MDGDNSLNADSESMFLNDLFGDALETDAVLESSGGLGLVGGETDPATTSSLNDFEMLEQDPDNLQVNFGGDDVNGLNEVIGRSASAHAMPGISRPAQAMQSGPPIVAAPTTSGGTGERVKMPGRRAGGGGRRRNGASKDKAAADGKDGSNTMNNGHSQMDVNGTEANHAHMAVVAGQVQ
jgi:hypothetical protein